MVAVTRQVPALAELKTPATIAQPEAVPLVTLKVTAPVPEPPVTFKVIEDPVFTLVWATTRVDWLALAMVTVMTEDTAELYTPSAAFDTFTRQVPTEVEVKRPFATEQPVAVPLTALKDVAPVPEPPL